MPKPWRSTRPPTPRRRRGSTGPAATSSTRKPTTSRAPHFRPNDPLYARAVEPAGDAARAGLGHQPGRDQRRSSSPCSTPAWRSTTRSSTSSRPRFTIGQTGLSGARHDHACPSPPRRSSARRSRYVAPRDFIWNDTDPVDLAGHGTHVAGTIGQLTNNGVGVAGVAFNVRLMPVKVLADQWDLIFDAPTSARPRWWRRAFATPPTTAPTSST